VGSKAPFLTVDGSPPIYPAPHFAFVPFPDSCTAGLRIGKLSAMSGVKSTAVA
jgi:hypothetical protein